MRDDLWLGETPPATTKNVVLIIEIEDVRGVLSTLLRIITAHADIRRIHGTEPCQGSARIEVSLELDNIANYNPLLEEIRATDAVLGCFGFQGPLPPDADITNLARIVASATRAWVDRADSSLKSQPQLAERLLAEHLIICAKATGSSPRSIAESTSLAFLLLQAGAESVDWLFPPLSS